MPTYSFFSGSFFLWLGDAPLYVDDGFTDGLIGVSGISCC
jgi:hypothetical protein